MTAFKTTAPERTATKKIKSCKSVALFLTLPNSRCFRTRDSSTKTMHSGCNAKRTRKGNWESKSLTQQESLPTSGRATHAPNALKLFA